MLLTLLYSGLIATSQAVPDDQNIVVIGRRIGDAEAALRACIARQCDPDEEIDASLALAETQILEGDYKDARKTLVRSLGRNKDEAARYPIPVSDLYRANGRVAAHLGYDQDYYRSTWGIYRTLKKGLPSAQTRRFQARIEVAEMVGRTRGHERARLYYADIAREARKAGRSDIAAIAELRSAIRHLPPNMGKTIVRQIAANRDPRMRAPALEASLALARLAYEENDTATAESIRSGFARFNLKRPVLIHAPGYMLVEGALNNGSSFDSGVANAEATGGHPLLALDPGYSKPGPAIMTMLPGQFSSTKRLAGNFDDMWADVTFRITPEGNVAEVKIARQKGDIFWLKPLLGSIQNRKYTPTTAGSSLRRERYTYTAGYERKTDTRLTGRAPAARIEYFDLSEEGATAL